MKGLPATNSAQATLNIQAGSLQIVSSGNCTKMYSPHRSASQADHSLVRKLKAYTEPTLLICDELGYLALDQQSSNLFYQVISTRHS
jgi:hypothetical protein